MIKEDAEREIIIEEEPRQFPYSIIENKIIDSFSELGATPLMMAAYLVLRRMMNNQTKECRIKQKTLAKKACQSVRTLAASLSGLEEMGFIRIKRNYDEKRKQWFASTYQIVAIFEFAAQQKMELHPIKRKIEPSASDDETEPLSEIAMTEDTSPPEMDEEDIDSAIINAGKKQIEYEENIEMYNQSINLALSKKDTISQERLRIKKELYEAVVTYFLNVLLSEKDYIIDSATVSNEDIKAKFLTLTSGNINYIVSAILNTKVQIKNKEAYVIKSLYTSRAAQGIDDAFWMAEADRDFAAISESRHKSDE